MSEDNQYRQARLDKAVALKEGGLNPFGNGVTAKDTAVALRAKYDVKTKEELEGFEEQFEVAGRVISVRSFGKAGFLKIRDASGEFQIYMQKGKMGEFGNISMKNLDVGDFVFAKGTLFRTKTDELTMQASEFFIVTKALQPLPEKWHGLTDVEVRYRRRYLDLVANPDVKKVFETRSKAVSFIRRYFEDQGYLEVETPMMHPIPGGATARPFVTHHNALDQELYLRIAPELYLKRLVVGGIEKVFEVNRNFRNEGISIQHNPEFTMLEFYQAWATYEDLIALSEDLLSKLVTEVCGSGDITYQGETISFSKPFQKIKLTDSLVEYAGLKAEQTDDVEFLAQFCKDKGWKVPSGTPDKGHLQLLIFEEIVEKKLMQPTFVTHYPTSVSPLSRRNDENPEVADRFELFIFGREIANGFSELNDPLDQKQRFLNQVEQREAGDDEAMYLDDDYINALEHGMPPAAGEGIGIDRLVMLLTDSPSIRDVILFPTLRRVES